MPPKTVAFAGRWLAAANEDLMPTFMGATRRVGRRSAHGQAGDPVVFLARWLDFHHDG